MRWVKTSARASSAGAETRTLIWALVVVRTCTAKIAARSRNSERCKQRCGTADRTAARGGGAGGAPENRPER